MEVKSDSQSSLYQQQLNEYLEKSRQHIYAKDFSSLKNDVIIIKEIISRSKSLESDNNQDNTQKLFYQLNEIIINYFDEKKESELDKIYERGAIDFKIFIMEQYDYYILLNNKKDNKEYIKKYFKLMNKYLKNEIEEIGINKYFLILLTQISSNNERPPSELNCLAFNEIMKCLNDNIQRIEDIWNININHRQEQNLIKNSFYVLYWYSYYILSALKVIYNNQNNINNNDIIIEINKQKKIFIENIPIIFSFYKKIEKENTNDNSDNNYNNVLEKFLLFFLQLINLFIRMESQIAKEKAEFICQSCCFMLKKGTNINLIESTLAFFWELINYCGRSTDNLNNNQETYNFLYNEMYKNWKKYFNFEIYLENKYISETKINKVLTYFIRIYTFCFDGNGGSSKTKGHQFLLFKNMIKLIEEDNYKIPMKLIEKINDFTINLENKIYIVNLIYDILNWFFTNQKIIDFDLVYFIINQITHFLYVLYSLHKDNDDIGFFLKEERQIQKDYCQKNIMEINLDNNDENIKYIKKYNLNGILYYLTKEKYDKYISIKDSKYFIEIFKTSQSSTQRSLYDIISKIIYFFKDKLKSISDKNSKHYYLDKISNILSKFFFYYFILYEKLRVNHQTHEQTEQNNIITLYIKELIIDTNLDLFVAFFKKLMHYVYILINQGEKLCPIKTCFLQKLIHNIFKIIKDEKIREKLFEIYFDFFLGKIYKIGNPQEIYDNIKNDGRALNESINYLKIIKSIFFNILDITTNLNFYKNKIISLIIDILYLSKDSEYFGNYIYILRCFYKYTKASISLSSSNEEEKKRNKEKNKLMDELYKETQYLLYPKLKYFINLNIKAPFFKDIISDIISMLYIKPRALNEIPDLIFQSLIYNLLNNEENKITNLNNLENWTNSYYIKNTESILPFIEKDIPKITEFLSNNILRFTNAKLCFFSMRYLSKIGGKGRNYYIDKKIISKTSPIQILSMKLSENKDENRNVNLILDYIIDIDIDNCINWNNKMLQKKVISEEEKKLIMNNIEIFKYCLSAFFHKKIDYKYILNVKKNIINGITNFNEKEFNSIYSFRQMNEKNSKIKINSVFRIKDHYIINKIITGNILINSTFMQFSVLQNDPFFINNDLIKFISDYFIMILLSKEKNNKNIFLFEQDPILFLDELFQFFFSTNPTIIKNTNVQMTDYLIKVFNNIIETLNNFFDNDINVIKNLEIVDIIYYKFLNCCYIYESNRIDIGLILMKILLKKFDKKINFKYLKYFFKAISSVTSNYNNIIKINFKKGCNNLIDVIQCLIDMFVINDINYLSLKEEDFKGKENCDNTTKENFVMLFDLIKYSFDDMVDKINTGNNYTREYGIYFIKKLYGKIPCLKNIIPILFQLDINNFTIIDFLKYFKDSNYKYNYRQILSNVNNNENNIEMKEINEDKNIKCILHKFKETKIYNKIDKILNALTHKLNIRETSFENIIANSDALNNIFELSPYLIKEYINNNIKLYLDVVQALYHNILISYFYYVYLYIYMFIENKEETFKSRFIYSFMEQLLADKNIEFNFEIKDDKNNKIKIKNEIPSEYIKYIEKYIYDNYTNINEVNNRYFIIGEIHEFIGLRINMVSNIIKLLNNIYEKYNDFFPEQKITNEEISIFLEYKKKITKLIFIHIFNIYNKQIIKQCTKFLKKILLNDNNLKEELYNEYNSKINEIINMINQEEIKDSNCGFNYELIVGLQPEYIDSLLHICKVLNINNDINLKNTLIQKLNTFDNISFDNSQLILFYGFISIFLYIDISNNDEIIYKIFDQMLFIIEESISFPEKKLMDLGQIKYRKKIIKLISKYRKILSKYIIEHSDDIYKNKKIIKLIKILINEENNSYNICETLFNEITNEFKINIMKNNDINNNNLIKITQLLKICQKISNKYKLYLKSTSILIIIEPLIKNISEKFEKNNENNEDLPQSQNNYYKKIIKYWIKLNIYYIKNFKPKKFYLTNLFFCKLLPLLPDIYKNLIDKCFLYNISILNKNQSKKDFEKNYKNIMNIFISLDSDIKKYFDIFVDILIIPMTINFYRYQNFFESYQKNKIVSNNNESTIIFDEEYLLNILEKLSFDLNKIKFSKEKKEESKYKLIILLIILYQEYISHNNTNKENTKLKNIYYNIQALLDYSPFYDKNKNQNGLWRIYLFLAICIFKDQNEREHEKNLDIIINFIKKLNDDYSEIQYIIYELILPNTNKEITLGTIFLSYIKENPYDGIIFFKILLKYPFIINKVGYYLIKEILNHIYKLRENIKFIEKRKSYIVQIIGLIISHIVKQRNNNLIEKDIEKKTYTVVYKMYKTLLFNIKEKDSEIYDIFNNLLLYIREIFNTQENLNIEIKLEDITKINIIHAHITFMRISFINFGYDSLIKNKNDIKFVFILNKYIINKKINHRVFNDYMIIFRLITDTKTFYELNKRQKVNDNYLLVFKINIMNELKEIMKDKNNMNNKYTNYNINDLKQANINNVNFKSITEKVLKYLIDNKYYPDLNAQNQNQIYQYPSLNTTLSSTDIMNNIRQQMPQISQDKWLESFQIYEFKNFIFYRKFYEEFYSNNNLDINNNINEIKNDLDIIFKSKKDNMDLIYYSTFCFFENFYFFTLFFLQEYYALYKKGFLYNNTSTKEINEYFESTHSFFFVMKKYDKNELNKIKNEKIELTVNEIENPNKKYLYNMTCIYPDIIFSAFLFFFQCDEIMEKYYYIILDLFLHTYVFLRDKFYEPCLIGLIEELVLNNKIMKKKSEEKNKFIFQFLLSLEHFSKFKSIRVNENIITIVVKYLQEFNTLNKKDTNINKILRIILYNSTKFDIEKRTNVFNIIKLYIGNDIISYLKWIFSLDDYDPNDIYHFIFFDTIPLSVDFLLSFFNQELPLIMNTYNFSKFKNLYDDNNNMEKDEENNIYDKKGFIKSLVDKCNKITEEKKVKDLLNPIHTLITSENFYYKIFIMVFTQIWKMLTSSEREIISVYINEFLYKYIKKQKEKNNMTINLLLDTFSQCSPIIYIKPNIIQALIPCQNFWNVNILYLENLLLNGIDIKNTYSSLINIFNTLKENELSNGLKYFFSESNTKTAYSELLAGNYFQAENIFNECINNLDKDNLDINILNNLSEWEDGLIECYKNSNKINNIIELGNFTNNNELIIKGLWLEGKEKWKILDEYIKNLSQKNDIINTPFIQFKEIYALFKKWKEEINNNNTSINDIDEKTQNIFIKYIQNFEQDFQLSYPKSMENIDNYYFLLFQILIESWESTNTLNGVLEKLKTGNIFNYKDNYLLWRERLPHYCEGFNTLKNILEPRNYLFNNLIQLVKEKYPNENMNLKLLPFCSDKVWNDMIFMKYARKLNLIETFYEKKKIFEEENNNLIKVYPYEIYLKDIECIKLIRNNTFNYDKGIILCDEYINKYKTIINENTKDFVDYIINDINRHKAYFYYKKGKIIEAHNLFIQASVYKNKENTDYHLYSDWAEMCEEITYLIADTDESDIWFENTLHNFIYSIIYKLSKAKFVIPRMIMFIKEFDNKKLKNKFNEDIDEIPIWVWIFWINILFENFNLYENDEEKNNFYFYILKKLANKYKQIFYYSYNVYNKILKDKKKLNNEILFANDKYEELYNILTEEKMYNEIFEKINIIIDELTKKEENNKNNPLKIILIMAEKATYQKDNMNEIKDFFKNIKFYLSKFNDPLNLTEEISNLLSNVDLTRKTLREFILKKKNYLHNLIITENKFKKINNLFEKRIFNIDLTDIEIPGFFSNKIIEPNDQSILYIAKFENECCHKLISDSRTNILIRSNNEKLIYFLIEKQDAEKNIENRIYLMQILFNYIFEKNYETYKRKIKFVTPIKYFINSKIKIIEEDIFLKYNMEEVYEYCLQKRGYDPSIIYQIFEEEGIKNNLDINFLYYSDINNQKIFEKMCRILPQDSFKNFVHKFNCSSEDIFLFRKQFAISYSINNLFSFIFNEVIFIKNINFNKENGFCLFNTDLNAFPDNEHIDKNITSLRLTKNISNFLCVTSIYGIIPGILYYASKALVNKKNILTSVLKICIEVGNNLWDKEKREKIVDKYIGKFKWIINDEEENNGMKNVFELIENSLNDDILKKKTY